MSKDYEIIGWTWAKACSLLDEGIDPRDYEIPKLLKDFEDGFEKEETEPQA